MTGKLTGDRLPRGRRRLLKTGVGFLIAGILCNQWLLGWLLTADGRIDDPFFIGLIWAIQVILIVSGYRRLRGHEKGTWKTRLFKLAAVFVAILAVEGLLHTASFLIDAPRDKLDRPAALSVYRGKPWSDAFFRELKEFTKSSWSYHPFLSWDTKRFQGSMINVDAHGLRKTWQSPRADTNSASVLVFGGSTIWGMFARDEHTVPSYLSKLLHQSGYNYAVSNCGDLAYTTSQELINLILLLKEGHRPQLVVFYDGVNDVYAAYQSGVPGGVMDVFGAEDRSHGRLSPMEHVRIGFQGLLADYSMIYQYAMRAREVVSPPPKFPEVGARFNDEQLRTLAAGIAESYARSMGVLEKLSEAYSFRFACFWQPVIFTESRVFDEETGDVRASDKSLSKLHHYVLEILRKRHLPRWTELSGALAGRTTTYYVDYCHLSEEGNETVARQMIDVLKPELPAP